MMDNNYMIHSNSNTYKYLIILFFCAISLSCLRNMVKQEEEKRPIYSEIDTEVMPYIEQFRQYALQNNITFSREISLGFTHIEKMNVIGRCVYGSHFREIELDLNYWKDASDKGKAALVWHEAAHCYCTRGHDFNDGIMYPDNSFKSILQRLMAKQPFSPLKPSGYFPDSCPLSIMHPVIVDDECFTAHFDHYVVEMFNRCKPF